MIDFGFLWMFFIRFEFLDLKNNDSTKYKRENKNDMICLLLLIELFKDYFDKQFSIFLK